MKTIVCIKYGVSVLKQIVKGFVGFLWNTYKMFLFVKLTYALKNWPEDIKVPLVIAAIEKE